MGQLTKIGPFKSNALLFTFVKKKHRVSSESKTKLNELIK